MAENGAVLVVTAHVGDFVWRCGGAIASHVEQGVPVHVICLSYGENGESNAAWQEDGAQREAVRELRRAEAQRAAALLGAASIDFHGLDDYPMTPGAHSIDRVALAMREVRPAFVLTHPERDPSNLDHCVTYELVLRARMKAAAPGHGGDHVVPPQVLSFEPHQPELCGFRPDLLLDISHVWERKLQAMHAMPTQQNLWAYYERVALQRGAQAGRRGQARATHAEAFQSIFPSVRRHFGGAQ